MILVGRQMTQTYPAFNNHYQIELRPGVSIPMPEPIGLNTQASITSGRLVQLAGLCRETATVAEMDARDARFVHPKFMTAAGYPVFSWRAALAVSFAVKGYRPGSKDFFRLATPDEEAQAKESEVALRAAAKAWSCNHCAEFMDMKEAETKPFILQHLRSKYLFILPFGFDSPVDYNTEGMA
ncbi:hypothetical protein NMY22_g14210 [Coprinellus aureogranulatus]|nr:hypothetical protein NMY22_g14210 [Coprinellus aureogranulatus]